MGRTAPAKKKKEINPYDNIPLEMEDMEFMEEDEEVRPIEIGKALYRRIQRSTAD